MSKWRPSNDAGCLYVIPDIHGASGLLDMVLKRILPLRKSDGIHDKIIFMGDYIDRHQDGHKVIDTLISLKQKYKENVICLTGNHELLMLQALGMIAADCSYYDSWIKNGGYFTLLGYMDRAGINEDPLNLNISRLRDFIPDAHKKFLLEDLVPYYELDNFVFVHGGFNPLSDISKVNIETLTWDRQLYKFVIEAIDNNQELPWDKVVVTGHNSFGRCRLPVITNKYMMLDCGGPKCLLITELQSMEAFMAFPDKNRLIKINLQETIGRHA
ncbi:MAG: metallophosphoesterase [bacterium]|nr:metallophosphoesterase [bacterium]